MLDLFKEVTHPYNLRNGLICGSYKIKTIRYGTETIAYLSPKIWSIVPDEIRESASLETFCEVNRKIVFIYLLLYSLLFL